MTILVKMQMWENWLFMGELSPRNEVYFIDNNFIKPSLIQYFIFEIRDTVKSIWGDVIIEPEFARFPFHPAPRATKPRGSGTRGQGSIFFIFDSWGLFKQNIFGWKTYSQGAGWGSPKWYGQICFRRCIRKKSIAVHEWWTDIFFVKQISDNLQSVGDQNHLVAYMRLPIEPPLNKPWFRQFFEYSGKARHIFPYYFLIL